jgi:hypothetical protein
MQAHDFSSNLWIQTGSEAGPASCTMGIRGSFPGSKARPGRDADHSPPSTAKVKKELDLYLLSSQAPSWRVAEPLLLVRRNGRSMGCSVREVIEWVAWGEKGEGNSAWYGS